MTLEQLLKHKPAASFTAQELSGKAFWRLQRGEHHAAHLLFEAACARARETGETWRCHRNRAATALAVCRPPASPVSRWFSAVSPWR